jgi:hypothetical protein
MRAFFQQAIPSNAAWQFAGAFEFSHTTSFLNVLSMFGIPPPFSASLCAFLRF